MLDNLSLYLSYPFVRYALIVGILIALSSSLLGVTLVLKRLSFIGDGLSHVAFGAVAIATVLRLVSSTIVVLPVTLLAAIFLLRGNSRSRIRGDAVIAMFSVGALAIGYLLLNMFSVSANVAGDVCGTLFGSASILTLSAVDVWICALLSLLVIVVFVLFYDRIFAVTFDETFAAATGIPTGLYNLIIAVITAVIIVLAMNLVGSLLISALVVFPAQSAMRVCRSFRAVTICSCCISVACAAVGILLSILLSTPTGSTVVVLDLFAFVVFWIIGRFRRA